MHEAFTHTQQFISMHTHTNTTTATGMEKKEHTQDSKEIKKNKSTKKHHKEREGGGLVEGEVVVVCGAPGDGERLRLRHTACWRDTGREEAMHSAPRKHCVYHRCPADIVRWCRTLWGSSCMRQGFSLPPHTYI